MWENRCKVAVSGVGFSKITRSAEVPLAAHALQAVKAAVEDYLGKAESERRKAFRFPSAEDAEASYKVLTAMATVELMPDPAAWKLVQKIVAKINPKVVQVDLNNLLNPTFVRNLEDSGFLPAARKKLR